MIFEFIVAADVVLFTSGSPGQGAQSGGAHGSVPPLPPRHDGPKQTYMFNDGL